MDDRTPSDVLLELRELTTIFPTRRGEVRAVNDLSFRLRQSQKLGIVGESGSGKSVTLLSILRLVAHPGRIAHGDVLFRGERLSEKSPRQMRQIRGREIAMVFQDPMTTLNPAFRVGDQVQESLRIHGVVPSSGKFLPRILDRRRRAGEMDRVLGAMADVGIPVPAQSSRRYPHQFSGGMQQRALIAIALSCEPQVLLADEPTTALDVTIQAQIMALLDKINREHGTAIVLVTHNLGLVAEFCEHIIVMYAGQMMERGTTDQVIEEAAHPYTRGLLRCLPRIGARQDQILPIPGLVPDLAELPPGCPFSPRCDEVMPECTTLDSIPLKRLPNGRSVRCLLY